MACCTIYRISRFWTQGSSNPSHASHRYSRTTLESATAVTEVGGCRSVLYSSLAFLEANPRAKRSNQRTLHVALVGMTGVGKSTLVNVLKGEEKAEVNNNVRPCTTRTIQYEVVEGGTRYYIWDTRGLNEASEQAAVPTRFLRFVGIVPNAERELKKLLRGEDPRVNLVLLCIDAKKIRVKDHWKNYNKIYADLCERKLKVAVVVTQMGERDFRGTEWKRTCEVTAKGVVEEFPDARLMEAVPKFEELDDPRLKECKSRILGLISNVC
ncbi:P-loop containing nucleoside triphosphate hydrolase protein [Lanmaoa asiatica]|nr:P-loop containing nucleoside triphosphate hydrolase protein [Lanmaoa asiatica]